MAESSRPLSPYLQYRWQITMVLSILHRSTGAALSAGAFVLVYWLVSIATGPEAYAQAMRYLDTLWMLPLLIGWSFCFFYHLANGVRHLAWDIGLGFEIRHVYLTGWTVVVVSTLLTAVFWAVVLGIAL